MISKFNSKIEYKIKIGKLSITRFAGFFKLEPKPTGKDSADPNQHWLQHNIV